MKPPAGPSRSSTRLKSWQQAAFHALWRALGLGRRFAVDGRKISLSRAVREVTRHGILQTLTPTVTVREARDEYAFRCTGHQEFVRVYTMLEREEGTVEWLRRELRPGDVLYDIGANIGAFTLYAASRLDDGLVYAFEPHLANAASLLRNVEINRRQTVVRVLSCPLSDEVAMVDFDYEDLRAGTAFSHVAASGGGEAQRSPHCSELKLATTIDRLLEDDVIRPADLVKIDIDGQELRVLKGMGGFLAGPNRPRAVQVEVSPQGRSELLEFMRSCGLELSTEHLSSGTTRLVEAGADPRGLPSNAIFRPSPRSEGE